MSGRIIMTDVFVCYTVLQPIILAMLLVLIVVWLCFPRLKVKEREGDSGQRQE